MLAKNELGQIGIPLSDGTKLFVLKEEIAGIKSSQSENRCRIYLRGINEKFESDYNALALSELIHTTTTKR